MNVQKAIELALAKVHKDHANVPDTVMLRCWQTVDNDPKWEPTVDRYFPMVEFRAQPGVMDSTGRGIMSMCGIMSATKAVDDPSHATVSLLFEKSLAVIYRLYGQDVNKQPGAELNTFLAVMTEHVPAIEFVFGGFTITENIAPFEEEGVNAIGITLTTHYTRKDI